MGKGEISRSVFFPFKSNINLSELTAAPRVLSLLSAAAIALSSAVSLSIGLAPYALCEQTDKQTIAGIEQKLFFKTYNDDDLDARLRRIEKRVFGDAMEGNFQERLAKVQTAIGPQVNPDGTVSGINAQPQSQSSSPQQYQQPAQPVPSAAEEKASATERAKVAAMAAREEQISKLLSDGVELWRHKRGPDAIDRFQQVIRLDPHNAEAHFSMGIVYESAGNFAQALSSYKAAADEQPGNRDYQEAVAAIQKKAAANKPNDDKKADLRQLAEDASNAYKSGDYISALSLYKELDSKAPNEALVKYNIGTLYLAAHDPVSALDYYKQALKLKPNEPRYRTAVDQLGANVQKAENEQKQIETQERQREQLEQKAMNAQAKQQKQGKQPNNPFTPFPQQQQQQNTDYMSGLGLAGKGSHGAVAITTIGIGSRAARAGLQIGDMIKAVDGTVVKSTKDINDLLSRKPLGAPVQLMIERGKQMGTINL